MGIFIDALSAYDAYLESVMPVEDAIRASVPNYAALLKIRFGWLSVEFVTLSFLVTSVDDGYNAARAMIINAVMGVLHREEPHHNFVIKSDWCEKGQELMVYVEWEKDPNV